MHTLLFACALCTALGMILTQSSWAGREGSGSTLQFRVCPCLKVWVLLRSFGCLRLQHPGSCLPALQAKDIPCISRSRFLQRSGCYAALFIPGMWHCLLSLYTWKGEPPVLLEKGSSLTNGHPCFQFWKHRVWSRRNPHSLVGGNPQQGFTAPGGITSLTTWS